MWYAGCSAADKKALLKAINTAVNDSSQPGHNLFELQPSGRHSLKTWVSQILFLLPQLIYIYILFIYYTYPPCQKSSPADWKSADPGALCSNYLFLNNLIVCSVTSWISKCKNVGLTWMQQTGEAFPISLFQ